MPNNCSTLIQRKQNHLQHVLKSNSEGKFRNADITTTELCIDGTRNAAMYSSPSTHNFGEMSMSHRSNLFPANHMQPSPNQLYDAHLPTIRYTKGNVDRHYQLHDEFHSRSRSRSKTPSANASLKSNGCTPLSSMSSIFNALARQSTENFMSSSNDFKDSMNPSPAPPSRRSQRPSRGLKMNENTTKHTAVHPKHSTDSGIDIRFFNGSGDTNYHQQVLVSSTQLRTNTPQAHVESHRIPEPVTKERTTLGQHYQRRPNNTTKAPIRQKIDKHRRRSEEVIQIMNDGPLIHSSNHGSPGTIPSPLPRSKLPPSPSPTAVRLVSSDGELQVETLRSSPKSNLNHSVDQTPNYSHNYSHHRVKSPYLYPINQRPSPTIPSAYPQTPPIRARRNHKTIQPISATNSAHSRRAQQNSTKQSINTNQKNLYLAFIASRYLSRLDDAPLECDTDRQKSLRIFTWLQGVEDHRHEQADYDQLLAEQNKRMETQEDNLSLYSEIQYAVDDLPANTSGRPCEKIATMQFED